jgi:hypothetical protein
LRPEAAQALKAYAKVWQGSRAAQVRVESAYRALGELAAASFPDTDAARLGHGVAARAARRVRYLQGPEALAHDVREAWQALVAEDYERCAGLCRTLLDGAYDRAPAAELALGVCEMRGGHTEAALRRFREVLALKRDGPSRVAEAAAFFAAQTLVRAGDADGALAMLRALQRDYPGTKLAERARGMADRLEAMAKVLAETAKASEPPRPPPPRSR